MTSILGPDKQQHIAKLARNAPNGAFAECGVYKGGVLKMLASAHPDRTVYGFDTFSGLPAAMWQDGEPHKVGDFSDTTFAAVKSEVAECANVVLVKGIFPDSAANGADEFALVHLDFDFYESTRAALEWFMPRMVSGGYIVFDDYEWDHCPGVKRAIAEAGLTVERSVPYQAVYRAP